MEKFSAAFGNYYTLSDMSRIGKVPVKIPSEVEVSISGQNVRVKGPKGELHKEFSSLAVITKDRKSVV